MGKMKNKKGLMGFFVGWLIIIILIAMMVYQFIFIQPRCSEKNLSFLCEEQEIRCYDNCKELGMQYFNYERSWFSNSDCWCRINNDTKQIW